MEAKKHVFTALEKKILLELIKKYSAIIENKDTDGASLRAKNDAWEKITKEYTIDPNSHSNATSKQLRRLWMNLKQRQREALTKERQHRLATGGGPSNSDAYVDPDISAITPALIVGVDSAIDSDSMPIMEVSPTPSPSTEVEIPFSIPFPPVPTTEMTTESSLPTQPLLTTQPSLTIQPSTEHYTVVTPPPTTPPPLTTQSQTMSAQRQKAAILEKEYADRKSRADEKHHFELCILKEQLRESKAKADLAELMLKQQLEKDNV